MNKKTLGTVWLLILFTWSSGEMCRFKNYSGVNNLFIPVRFIGLSQRKNLFAYSQKKGG